MPRVFVLLIAALLLGPSSSSAEETTEASQQSAAEQASEHSRLGVEAYKEGRLPEAVKEMLTAYNLFPDVTLLYNIARIYQKMEQPDLAITYFKKFVAEEGADPDTVQAALEHMATLVNDKAQAESSVPVLESEPEPEPEPEPVAPDIPEPAVEEQSTGAAAVAPVVQTRPMHPAPWITGSVAGAALATLGISGAAALFEQGRAQEPTRGWEERLEAKALSDDLGVVADVSLGVGVAATVATVILAVATRHKAAPVVLLPVGPGGVPGLGLSMRFGAPAGRSR